MNRCAAIPLAFAVWSQAHPAAAQTQVRSSLSGYVDLGLRVQSASSFFLASGETRDSANLELITLPLYVELGLVDRWLMLTLQADLYRRNALDERAATSGLGDARVGLWTTVFEGPVRVLAGAQLGLPTGDPYPEGVDADTDFDALLLPTGDGEFDVELTVSVTRALEFSGYPLRHYLNARAGYWIRTTPRDPEEGSTAEAVLQAGDSDGPEKIADAIAYGFEAGTQIKHGFFERIWWVASLGGVQSFTEADGSQFGIGLGNGVSYLNLGVQASLELPAGFGLGARVDAPLSGALVLNGPSYRFFGSFRF